MLQSLEKPHSNAKIETEDMQYKSIKCSCLKLFKSSLINVTAFAAPVSVCPALHKF